MTADQAVERQAAQECRASKALQLLDALSVAEDVYIEAGGYAIRQRFYNEKPVWVVSHWTAHPIETITFDTLAEAIAKALNQ